jgi:putative transposase
MLAVAEMYIKGVSTREVEAVMREFGIESLSSSQVSRAAKLLDDELEAWRNRPLGEIRYLILDARYEKMRHGGVVRDAAVLSAIGIGPDERRRVLGVSVALSEAEVHWRAFLESLQARGLRGVEYVVSDDHAGLRAARRAVLGGATWQRCQFHLAQNAIHHAPSLAIRKRIGAELRAVWNAGSLAKAETALAELVAAYRDTAPKLAHGWRKTSPKASPSSRCPSTTAVACAPPTRWSAPSSRSSSAAPSRSGSSPTRPRSNASSAQCWSRSTTNGPPTPRPTSNGNVRMRDHAPIREFPDNRLLNP